MAPPKKRTPGKIAELMGSNLLNSIPCRKTSCPTFDTGSTAPVAGATPCFRSNLRNGGAHNQTQCGVRNPVHSDIWQAVAEKEHGGTIALYVARDGGRPVTGTVAEDTELQAEALLLTICDLLHHNHVLMPR